MLIGLNKFAGAEEAVKVSDCWHNVPGFETLLSWPKCFFKNRFHCVHLFQKPIEYFRHHRCKQGCHKENSRNCSSVEKNKEQTLSFSIHVCFNSPLGMFSLQQQYVIWDQLLADALLLICCSDATEWYHRSVVSMASLSYQEHWPLFQNHLT